MTMPLRPPTLFFFSLGGEKKNHEFTGNTENMFAFRTIQVTKRIWTGRTNYPPSAAADRRSNCALVEPKTHRSAASAYLLHCSPADVAGLSIQRPLMKLLSVKTKMGIHLFNDPIFCTA